MHCSLWAKRYRAETNNKVCTTDHWWPQLTSLESQMRIHAGGAIYSLKYNQSAVVAIEKGEINPHSFSEFECRIQFCHQMKRVSVNRLFNALIKRNVSALIAKNTLEI